MKSQLSPPALAVILVLAIAVLGLVGWKYLGSNTAAPSEDLKPVHLDPSKLKASDFDQIRKELNAASATRSGIAGGGEKRAEAAGNTTN